MKSLDKYQLLRLGIQKRFYSTLDFCVSLFAELIETDKDGFKNGVPYRTKDGVFISIDGEIYNITHGKGPLFKPQDEIEVDATWSDWFKGSVKTTVGRLLSNMVLCYGPGLYKHIPYINRKFSIRDIEDYITVLLKSDEENVVETYERFVDAVSYYVNLSLYINITATPKNILPPPGLKEKREKLLKEKYGGKITTYEDMAAFEKDLQKLDEEWLKDDPSYGKFVSGKVKGISRKKLYMTFGAEAGFSEDKKARPVITSLEEGWPDKPEELVEMFNSARAGSFSRGAETQQGGVAAKILLRATNNLSIVLEDCGANKTLDVLLTEDLVPKFSGRYIMVNGVPKLLTDSLVSKYIGKVVSFRSPLYCNAPKGQFCKKCAGEELSRTEGGIALAATEISSKIITASMKAMHGVVLSTVEIDLEEMFT